MAAPDRPIFLIGMMGCGKSTIGRLLARKLHMPLCDLDEEIVRFEGRSIPEIFTELGDAGFRQRETAALRRVCDGTPVIVATGGGVITREENITLMRESGTVIWLCRPLEDIVKNVHQESRPLLAGDKQERMRALYTAREPLYRQAAHIAFSNHMPPEESSSLLAELLLRQP